MTLDETIDKLVRLRNENPAWAKAKVFVQDINEDEKLALALNAVPELGESTYDGKYIVLYSW